MADKKYNVIISDRVKRELGPSIRFIAQVSKEAAAAKKERAYSSNAFTGTYAAAFSVF